MWMEEEGFFHTIGVINSSPDSKWCHISCSVANDSFTHSCNGVMDVVVARKGGCCRDMTFALSYVVGQEYNNDLMSYIKAKALEIHSTTDEVVMLDGEVFPGPNPFRFVSVPSLLTVFGEYSCVCTKQRCNYMNLASTAFQFTTASQFSKYFGRACL